MVAAKDAFEGSSSDAESARRVMKLLSRRGLEGQSNGSG